MKYGTILSVLVALSLSSWASAADLPTVTFDMQTDPGWVGTNNNNPIDNGGDAGATSGFDVGYDAVNKRVGGRVDRVGKAEFAVSNYAFPMGNINPLNTDLEYHIDLLIEGNTEVLFGFFDRKNPLSEIDATFDSSLIGHATSANWLFAEPFWPEGHGAFVSADPPNDRGVAGRYNAPMHIDAYWEPDVGFGQLRWNYTGEEDRIVALSEVQRASMEETGIVFKAFGLAGLADNGSHPAASPPTNNLWITGATFSVPEPAALGILGAGCLMIFGKRRRRSA